jgi:hypothetical protein
MLSSFYYRISFYFYNFCEFCGNSLDIHPRWYLATIILSILIIYFTIKIKYPFWNLQPVYHTYDFWRKWSSTPFIIQKSYPFQTKFCDFKNIKTREFLDLDVNTLQNLADLLVSHYIPSDQVLFTITPKHLHDYFTGQLNPSYVSIYYEKRYSVDTTVDKGPSPTNELPYVNHMIGAITSRSISIFVLPRTTDSTHYIKYPCYYWDYVCVHRDHKNANIGRKLIQTHEYNQRVNNRGVLISMFKKEGDLSVGIVPLVEYSSFTLSIPLLKLRKIPKHCFLTRINKTSFGDFNDFMLQYLKSPGKDFPFAAIPDIGVLNHLIESENLYVFMLRKRENVLAIYFFKDAKIQDEYTNGCTLQCIGSICNMLDRELFYLGFLHSVYKITWKTHYKILLFESIGHNVYFTMDFMRDCGGGFVEQKNAYYLYNFVINSIHAKDALIIC